MVAGINLIFTAKLHYGSDFNSKTQARAIYYGA